MREIMGSLILKYNSHSIDRFSWVRHLLAAFMLIVSSTFQKKLWFMQGRMEYGMLERRVYYNLINKSSIVPDSNSL